MKKTQEIKEGEIDLIELARLIWSRKSFILKATTAFFVLGIVIAFTSKVEYEASCKLLPESQERMEGDLNGLGGLAGLAGIKLDLGSGGGVLTPGLYPEIVRSLPVQMKILNDTVFFETKGTRTTSFHYFKEIDRPSMLGYLSKYTIGLPGLIKGFFSVEEGLGNSIASFGYDSLIRISKEDWKLIEQFKERITVSVDKKSGVIDMSMEMPDPVASAQITKLIIDLLTEEVTNYKINKAKDNLLYVSRSYDDARKKFEQAQLALAKATDKNRGMVSAIANIELQRLKNEYDLAFEVYRELASQVEQAKIKLKTETPVFTVLEPVRVPEDKSKPKRAIIIALFSLAGLFSSVLFIIMKKKFIV